MKKTNAFILLFALLLFAGGDVTAQGWLNKVSKAIDKAGKQVDKQMKKIDEALGTDTENNNTATTTTATTTNTVPADGIQNYSGVKIKSFSPQVAISIVSCIRDGNMVKITYIAKNNGPQLSLMNLGTRRTIINPDDETNIYDNLGNTYKFEYLSLGKNASYNANQAIDALLIQNVPMRGTIEIKSVDSRAKSFSLVNIAGLINETAHKSTPFSLTFNDVPIYNMEDILKSITTKKVDIPYVERQTNADTQIKAIYLTNEFTRLDMAWTNTKYSQGSVWLSNLETTYIEIGGRKYNLLEFAGIGKSSGEVSIRQNGVINYSLTFEKIPDNTESFNLYHDGWDFFNVRLVPASSVVKSTATTSSTGQKATSSGTTSGGINIPKTKGVMSMDDAFNAYDNRRRITATERTALKINYIKGGDFNSKWLNSKLSKGKLIYKGAQGTLQTIFFIEKDQATDEYLVSYDANGNFVDCISIGSIRAYGGDRGQAAIEGNEILACFSAEGIDLYRKYQITPQLKFKLIKEWQTGEANDY